MPFGPLPVVRPFRTLIFIVAAVLLAMVVFLEDAAIAGDAGPFREGSMRLSVELGSGTAFQKDYTVIGAGAGYYISDGLELGIDMESWEGNDPRITRLSPRLLYVVPVEGTIKPYIGVFYRRVFIEQREDANDAGARAGAFFLTGGRAYIGLGASYETHLNCDRSVYESCNEIFPEMQIAILF